MNVIFQSRGEAILHDRFIRLSNWNREMQKSMSRETFITNININSMLIFQDIEIFLFLKFKSILVFSGLQNIKLIKD